MPRIDVTVPDIPKPLANYTPAARAGDLVFAGGPAGERLQAGGGRRGARRSRVSFYGSAIKKQTRYILENLARTLEAAGTSLSHVVKAQVFHTDLANFAGFDEVWREFFPTPPPRTTIGTTGLLVPGALVEVDLIAAMPRAPAASPQSDVPAAPRELLGGRGGRRSGLRGRSARQRLQDGRAARSARRPGLSVLRLGHQAPDALRPREPRAHVQGGGTSLEHVVKAQVFHTDLNNFFAFDEVWREFFPTPPPRTTVGTTGLLVRDTLVEIDLIAALPSARPHPISVPDIPAPLAHYTPATRVGELVFAAGQIASDYRTGVPREARVDPAFPTTARTSSARRATSSRTWRGRSRRPGRRSSTSSRRRSSTPISAIRPLRRGVDRVLPAPPPRTTVGTTGLLVPGTLVEIDLIAAMP